MAIPKSYVKKLWGSTGSGRVDFPFKIRQGKRAMEAPITTIKEELNRRYSHSLKVVPEAQDPHEICVNFTAVFDYLAFIEITPLLNHLIAEDRKHEEGLHTELLFDYAHKPDIDAVADINYDNFNDFHICLHYDYLREFIYEPIHRLNREVEPTKMDAWGLAFTKSPYRILTMPLPWKQKIKVIKNKIKRGSEDVQHLVYKSLNDLHNGLLGLLAEYEVRMKDKTNQPSEVALEPSEAVLVLGIAPDSRWEDITIKFKDEYLVTISYQGTELETRHEAMGFSDKRNPDRFRAKDSWLLLVLLSASEGTFKLAGLTRKEKAKRQKQKQELTKLLKKYFQIESDPFYETDKDNPEYKIKLKLIPDPTFRDQYEDRRKQIFDSKNVPRSAYLMNFPDDLDDEIS